MKGWINLSQAEWHRRWMIFEGCFALVFVLLLIHSGWNAVNAEGEWAWIAWVAVAFEAVMVWRSARRTRKEFHAYIEAVEHDRETRG